MDLACPTCGAVSTVPDDRLPPEGARARCHGCQRWSVYLRGGLVDDDPTPPQGVAAPGSHATARPAPPPPPGPWTTGPHAAARTTGPHAAVTSTGPHAAARTTGPHAAVTSTGPHAAVRTSGSHAAVDMAGPWRLKTPLGEEGPLEFAEVKNRIRTGALFEDDSVMPPNTTAYQRAGDHVELARWFALRRKTGDAAGPVRCWRHPAVTAKWLCAKCGSSACDACIKVKQAQRVTVRQCGRCEGVVTEIVPTKVVVPFWHEIPNVLSYPVRSGAWIGLLICTVVSLMAWVAAQAPAPLGWIAAGFPTLCIYAYHLFIIRETAKGKRTLPNFGHVNDYKTDMVYPGLKAFIVSLIVIIPVWLWAGTRLLPAELAVPFAESHLESERAAHREWEERRRNPPEEDRGGGGDAFFGQEGEMSDEQAAFAAAMEGLLAGMPDAGTPEDGQPAWMRGYEEPEPDVKAAEAALEKAEGRRFRNRLGFLFIAGWALATWPALMIIVALFNTMAPAFQPQVVMRLIREIPREYAWCAAFSGALLAVAAIMQVALRWIPFGGVVLAEVGVLYCTFVAFHVMGRTAELAEQKLDWS